MLDTGAATLTQAPDGEDRMSEIVQPSQETIAALVQPYLDLQAQGTSLAFVVGMASPDPAFSETYTFGSVQIHEGLPLTLSNDTPFLIASVSKTFTATAYAYYLDAMEEASTLGDFPELEIGSQFHGISLTSLVNYTSGLPADNKNPADGPAHIPHPYSIPGMLGFLNYTQMQPETPDYRYSNLGFALMGAVLPFYSDTEDAYEHIVIDVIFDPLDMSAQFFEEVRLDTLPQAYQFEGHAYKGIANPGWEWFPAYNAAGGVVASPSDMMTWLQFNMGLLPDCPLNSLLETLQTPSTAITTKNGSQLGLGWFISHQKSGFSTVWKDGALQGFNSYIAFLPSDAPGSIPSAAGVFVLCNSSGMKVDGTGSAAVCGALANDVLHLMQGLTPPTDKSGYPSSDEG